MARIKFSLGLKLFLIIFFCVTYFLSLVVRSAHQGYQLEVRCHNGYHEPGTFCSVRSNGLFQPPKPYETCLNKNQFCRGGAYDVITVEPVNIKTPFMRVLDALIMPIIYTGVFIAIISGVKYAYAKFKKDKQK